MANVEDDAVEEIVEVQAAAQTFRDVICEILGIPAVSSHVVASEAFQGSCTAKSILSRPILQ